MITYKELGFVAYPVTRMAAARKFYEKVLGLKPTFLTADKNPKWVEYNIGPGTLAIGSSAQWKPSKHGPSAALEVTDFAAAVAHLKEHRVKFIIGPLDMPSCRMATFRDPDGNKLSLHQRKQPAT